MRDRHPTPSELADLRELKAPCPEVVEHLFSCESCWRRAAEALAFLEEAARSTSSGGKARAFLEREGPVRALVERFRLEKTRLESKLLAQAAIGELRRFEDVKRRREEITRGRKFQTLAVAEELLSEARLSPSAVDAEGWAKLALQVCHQLSPGAVSDSMRADTLAYCFAELANALRRSARWESARKSLEQGEDQAKMGSGMPEVLGQVLAVAGALEGDLGMLEQAEAALKRAATYFRAAGDVSLEARTMIQLAYVLLDAYPQRSLEYLLAGTGILPESDKRMIMFAEGIRVDALITLGEHHQALRCFEGLTSLYEQFTDAYTQLRRRWTAGRLLEALGRYEEADALFSEVIARDLEQRSVKTLFLDLVYMYGSYAKRGDLPRAVRTCEDAIRWLSILDLEPSARESMKALWLGLRSQAQRGPVAAALVLKATRFVRSQWTPMGGDPLATKESAI